MVSVLIVVRLNMKLPVPPVVTVGCLFLSPVIRTLVVDAAIRHIALITCPQPGLSAGCATRNSLAPKGSVPPRTVVSRRMNNLLSPCILI